MNWFKSFSILVLLLVFGNSHGQVEVPIKPLEYFPRYELGVQGTQLVKQILSLGNSTVSTINPYLLSLKYKSRKKPNDYTRMGFGLSIETIRNTDNSTNSFLNFIDFRIGKEKRYKFNDRFFVNYGWDFLFGFGNNITTNDNSINNFIAGETKVGFGPMLGIEYAIMKNFKIGTECNANILWETQFTNLQDGFRTGINVTMSPPAVLYFTFIFNDKAKKLSKRDKYKYDYEEYDSRKTKDFRFKSFKN